MTPFDSYFAAHIAPALKGAPDSAVKMARASAAEIWNAAIEEARRWMAAPHDRTEQTDLMANFASVTPIDGVILKKSQ